MANAIFNVGQTGGQVNISTAVAPATPAAGVVTLYAGTDKALHALNSDGVDITIAAAGASPIEVVNTTTLVSEGIGASAGSAADSIVLGNAATSNFNNTVVIGKTVAAKKIGDIAIGSNIVTPTTSAQCSVYLGNCITPGGNCAAATVLGQVMVGFKVSQNRANENIGGSVLLGHCITNNHQPGAGSDGDTMVGICSTIACSRGNNAIFGRLNTAGGSTNTVIGFNNNYTATDSISHYYNVLVGSNNCLGASTFQSVVIGQGSCATESNAISIGAEAKACSDGTIAIGRLSRVCQNPYEHGAIAIGTCAQANGIFSTVIGFKACTTGGHDQVVVGRAACANDTSTAIGDSAKATGCVAISIGYFTTASSNGSITIGGNSSASHGNAVVLGTGLSSERANTTHVDSLIAYGQAASKTNAVGSTGGTVTLNWDNSNIQTLTLTSNISTLTKSNPIDGAVYTLFLTQGGTGGKTVAWGADVNWPGGTPPTLSTAVGSTDAVSLVYIAGVTGYYGNANLNFS